MNVVWTVILLCLAAMLAGCGSEAYEQRLQETRKYFAHLETLEKNLSPTVWRQDGIEIRVPKSFREVPVETAVSDGEVNASETPRRKQSGLLNIPLPGVEAAWKGEVHVAGLLGGSQSSCEMYLLSNRRLLRQGGTPDDIDAPLHFHEVAVDEIADALGEPTNILDWDEETYPPADSYSDHRPKVFRHEVLQPRNEFRDRDFWFYLASFGDVRIVILFVIPAGIDPQESLQESIRLCLETLNAVEE